MIHVQIHRATVSYQVTKMLFFANKCKTDGFWIDSRGLFKKIFVMHYVMYININFQRTNARLGAVFTIIISTVLGHYGAFTKFQVEYLLLIFFLLLRLVYNPLLEILYIYSNICNCLQFFQLYLQFHLEAYCFRIKLDI